MQQKNSNTLKHRLSLIYKQVQFRKIHRSLVTTVPRFIVVQRSKWPKFVQDCPTTNEVVDLIGALHWKCLPTPTVQHKAGRQQVLPAAYIASFFVKLTYQIPSVSALHRFLLNHPALIWAFGFPLHFDSEQPFGFSPKLSLPSRKQFSHVLTHFPNDHLQKLMDHQVRRLRKMYPKHFGKTVSMDTKHILAWVKENNPRAYIDEGRFDKNHQPLGDSDCKLGCKRRHNRISPTREGKPASGLSVSIGEFYWGYASGAVVTKVPDVGEFILAEMTQTFDKGDTTYFYPLMEQVENRLGFRPTYFTADAAYDAFYIYDYFHNPQIGGFAAIPFSQKGGKPDRLFDENGTPVCDADLSMSLKMTYNDNTTSIRPYRRQKFVCPLVYPEKTSVSCPIAHTKWAKGGCTTTLAESVGSRLRHQLDRDSEIYKDVFKQRTAVERAFSRAKELGIERPKLRNEKAIVNMNSLIYILLNQKLIKRATGNS